MTRRACHHSTVFYLFAGTGMRCIADVAIRGQMESKAFRFTSTSALS
jgi:hypothetical protein